MPTATAAKPRSPKPPAAEYHEREVARRLNQLCGGYTLVELEAVFDMPNETIRKQLKGMVRPSLELVAKVCAVTGTSAEWVLFGIGERTAPGRSPRKAKLAQVN